MSLPRLWDWGSPGFIPKGLCSHPKLHFPRNKLFTSSSEAAFFFSFSQLLQGFLSFSPFSLKKKKERQWERSSTLNFSINVKVKRMSNPKKLSGKAWEDAYFIQREPMLPNQVSDHKRLMSS